MKIVLKNRRARLIDPALPAYLTLLQKRFCYEKSWQEIRHLPSWAPKTVPMISNKGVFWIGLLPSIKRYFEELGVRYEIIDERTPVDKSYLANAKTRLNAMPFLLRDYQLEAVRQGLRYFQGLFYIATGGGKTIILSALASIIDKKTFLVVDKTDLAFQLAEELPAYMGRPKSEFNVITSKGVKSLAEELSKIRKAQFNIALASSLYNTRFPEHKQEVMDAAMRDCEYLIIDEAHHAQSPTVQEIIKRCKNARLFHAFTATPMTSIYKGSSGNTKRDIEFKAIFGEILFKKKTIDLIDEGWLARPTVYMIKNRIDNDGDEILEYNLEFDNWILENDERNLLIAKMMYLYYKEDRQAITFVTRIDHGYAISEKLQEEFGVPIEDIAYVTGEDDPEYRQELIQRFKNDEVKILIGTVLSEGLNFFCDAGCNASAGRSDKLAIQRLGRILRKKRTETGDVDINTEERVAFFDFMDLGHVMFAKQSRERVKLMRAEGHIIKTIEVEELLNAEEANF